MIIFLSRTYETNYNYGKKEKFLIIEEIHLYYNYGKKEKFLIIEEIHLYYNYGKKEKFLIIEEIHLYFKSINRKLFKYTHIELKVTIYVLVG